MGKNSFKIQLFLNLWHQLSCLNIFIIFMQLSLSHIKPMQASTISERIRMKSELVLKRRMIPQTAGPFSRHDSLRSRQSDEAKTMRDSQSRFADLFKNKFNRLIQENKVQQVLHTEAHRKSSIFENDFANEVREESRKVKKEFNDLVLKRKAKENQIFHMKEQIKLFQEKRKGLSNGLEFYKSNIDTVDQKSSKIKQKYESNCWQLKSYEYIKEQTTKDLLIFKARSRQLEDYANYYKTHLRNLNIQELNLTQTKKNLNQMLQKARLIADTELSQKNTLMNTYQQEVSEKRSIDKIIVQRDKKMEDIKQLATSELQKEQFARYYELYVVHKVLAAVIDNKSLKLMKDHKVEQDAFGYIRHHTNMTDIDKLLERMENHDRIYQGLLDKISSLEREIEEAQEEVDEAGKEKINVFKRQGQAFAVHKGEYLGYDKEEIARLNLIKTHKQVQLKQIQRLHKDLLEWIEANSLSFQIQFNKGQEASCLEKICNKLTQQLLKK